MNYRTARYGFQFTTIVMAIVMIVTLLLPLRVVRAEHFKEPATVLALKKQLSQLFSERKQLEKYKQDLLTEQAMLADEIERLKASDPGVFGRLRLERLLARNLEVSRQLETVERNLASNEMSQQTKKQDIYRAYTVEMEKVVQLLRITADKKTAADLAGKFYELQRHRELWRSPAMVDTDFALFTVEISPQDRAQEIITKAEMLEDLVKKIRTAIKHIDERLDRLQRELRLNNEMQDMVHEMNLFQEGTRFQVPERDLRQTEPAPTEPEQADESTLHMPPLPEQGEMPGGAERVTGSIKKEIKQLKDERAFLAQLSAKLSAKAAEFRRIARSR